MTLLTEIGEAMLAMNIVGLLLILRLKRKSTSFEVIAFATIFLGLSHLAWEYYLTSLFGIEEYKQFVRIGWYLGFAVTYLFHVIFCAWYCKYKNLIRDRASNTILIAFTLASFLQVARYADRNVFNTEIFQGLYTNGIPTINALCTIAILLHVMAVYCLHYYPHLSENRIIKALGQIKFFRPALRGIIRWIR